MNHSCVNFVYRLTSNCQPQLKSFFQRSSITDYDYLLPIVIAEGFSAASFNGLYCYLSKESVKSFIELLPSGSAMSYYILDAQFFLHPTLVRHREQKTITLETKRDSAVPVPTPSPWTDFDSISQGMSKFQAPVSNI
jgi:hypothetical protein